MRGELGRAGVWSMELRNAGRPEVRDAVAELDELGWGSIWLPGLDGAGVLDDVGHVLDATRTATVVTGVLNIWGRSPADLAAGPRTVLGLGIGSPAGAAAHGQRYGNPVESMSRYLDGLGVPVERRLLGALGPRMVDLAVARTSGWHPFLVTPDYVAEERARVGDAPVIAPHQTVVLETDPVVAREAARNAVGIFLGFPTYRANLRRLGFTDADLGPGGSDRLIDALVAHGTADDIARRVHDHLDAGADHVAVHVVTPAGSPALPLAQWRELAFLTQ